MVLQEEEIPAIRDMFLLHAKSTLIDIWRVVNYVERSLDDIVRSHTTMLMTTYQLSLAEYLELLRY